MARAVRRSQSQSKLLSGSGKRHPPGETDPCGSEQQQLPGTNSALAPHMHIVDDKIAGKGVAILGHGSWRQAAFGQSHHPAETLAVPMADVGIDEMVNIVQAKRRRRQNFVRQAEQVEIVDRHYFVFNAHGIDLNLEVAVGMGQGNGIVQMAERHGLHAEQQRAVRALAAQDDGTRGVALHGNWKQRPVAVGRGVARHQQCGLNVFIGAHPAERGFDCKMQRGAAAGFET